MPSNSFLPLLPSPLHPPPPPQTPSLSPSLTRLPRRSQPRVHGQGEGPRGCRQRGPDQKWRFSAFPGFSRDPPAPRPRCAPAEALGEGARLWEESLRFVPIRRNCRGGAAGASGGEARWPSPRRVLRGPRRRTLQVTARVDSVSPHRKPCASRGRGPSEGAPGLPFLETLSAVNFFFSFPFLFFLKESSATTSPPQLHHRVQGLLCFLRFFPPTNHLSDQFYLRPPPSSPLSPPPPSQTPFSEVRHFTNPYMLFFEL